MQCKCGGEMKERTTVKNKEVVCIYMYCECTRVHVKWRADDNPEQDELKLKN